MFALLAAAFATQVVISGATNCTSGATTCAVDGIEMELQETVENEGANLLQYQGDSKDGNSIEKLDRSTALADGCGNKEEKKACRKTLRKCQANAKDECTKQVADACDGCLTTVPEYAEYVTALPDGCGKKEEKKCRKKLEKCKGPNAKDECAEQIADACDVCLTTVEEYAEYVEAGQEKEGSGEHKCPEIAGDYNIGDATTGTIIASMTVSSKTKSFVSAVIGITGEKIKGSISAKIGESCYGVGSFDNGILDEKERVKFRYTDNVIAWYNKANWTKME